MLLTVVLFDTRSHSLDPSESSPLVLHGEDKPVAEQAQAGLDIAGPFELLRLAPTP